MVETLYNKSGVIYSDKCFDKGLRQFAENPRAPRLAPNWSVAEARTDSPTDSMIARVGGRVLEGVLSIPVGYIGNSKVLRFLLSEGLASKYAPIATDMNQKGQWFAYRETLLDSLKSFSKDVRKGIEIKADEVKGEQVTISLGNFGTDPKALVLYGGWGGEKIIITKKAKNHANWLSNFKAVEKNGVILYVPSDETVNNIGRPVDTQIWSGGSGDGFLLDPDGGYLDGSDGVFGVLD